MLRITLNESCFLSNIASSQHKVLLSYGKKNIQSNIYEIFFKEKSKNQNNKLKKPTMVRALQLKMYLRGYYTPNLQLACFVSYLKIINTFFER